MRVNADISSLDVPALIYLAEVYETQACQLRRRAQVLSERASEEKLATLRLEKIYNEAPRAVLRALRRGYTLPEAYQRATEETGLLRETIEIHWKFFMRSKKNRCPA